MGAGRFFSVNLGGLLDCQSQCAARTEESKRGQVTDIDTSYGPESINPETGFYLPKSIKRSRRTKATIEGIRQHIYDILSNDNPQTVRQVFYALTVRGAIAKLEPEYHRTVVRLLTENNVHEPWRVPSCGRQRL